MRPLRPAVARPRRRARRARRGRRRPRLGDGRPAARAARRSSEVVGELGAVASPDSASPSAMVRCIVPRRVRLSRSSTACCTRAWGKVTEPVGPSSASTPSPMAASTRVEQLVAREPAVAGEHGHGGIGAGDRRDARPGAPSARRAGRVGRRGRSRTDAGRTSPASPCSASSVTKNGLPPVARWMAWAAGSAARQPPASSSSATSSGSRPPTGSRSSRPSRRSVGAEALEVRRRRSRAGPPVADKQHVRRALVAQHVVEQPERQLVGPLQVVEHEHHRPDRRLGLEQFGDGLEEDVALGADLGPHDLHAGHDLGEVGDEQRQRACGPRRRGAAPPARPCAAPSAAPRPSARRERSPRSSPGPTGRSRPRRGPPGRSGSRGATCRRPPHPWRSPSGGGPGAPPPMTPAGPPARRPGRRTARRGGASRRPAGDRGCRGGTCRFAGLGDDRRGRRRHRHRPRARSARGEPLLVGEDGRLQLDELGAGFEAELLDQALPRAVDGAERLHLAPERYRLSISCAANRSCIGLSSTAWSISAMASSWRPSAISASKRTCMATSRSSSRWTAAARPHSVSATSA